MAIKAPEGTRDLLPEEAAFWNDFKQLAARIFSKYGYQLIETPIVEQTELFVRGIGEATDVVSKEMFTAISGNNLATLLDGGTIKSKSKLSMRPEGTAGVVRAVVEHDLVPQGAPPAKLMYAGPMFRAERPQKGRQRQFNQVGIECLGAEDPTVDAEAIIMLMRFFEAAGLPKDSMRLLINSMGCEKCRPAYRDLVHAYLTEHSAEVCETCNTRAEINPLRAFDCKNEGCSHVMQDAPKISDHLCDECREHYETVKAFLDGAGVSYIEDYKLVRGLDYYTRTVFEVQVDNGMGSQNAIGGGGRYDKLAEEVGGRPTPGFGFALGYERCALALQAAGVEFKRASACKLFVATVEAQARSAAFDLVQQCRDAGVATEMDHQARSLKSQFKLADKLGASYVAVLGPDEIAQSVVNLRNMQTHDETQVALCEVASKLA
jgi:histidyl-tRNA synthetase